MKNKANNETQILQNKVLAPQQFNYESFKQFYDKENESLHEFYENYNEQLSHFSSKDFAQSLNTINNYFIYKKTF